MRAESRARCSMHLELILPGLPCRVGGAASREAGPFLGAWSAEKTRSFRRPAHRTTHEITEYRQGSGGSPQWRPQTLAQSEAQDLARPSTRDLINKVNGMRQLVGRQSLAQELEQLGRIGRVATPWNDEDDRHLAEERVASPHHRAVEDALECPRDLLDFGGRDVHPSTDDQFLEPSGDGQISVWVCLREITGVIPAPLQGGRALLRLVVIAGHETGPAYDQLALGTRLDVGTARWI